MGATKKFWLQSNQMSLLSKQYILLSAFFNVNWYFNKIYESNQSTIKLIRTRQYRLNSYRTSLNIGFITQFFATWELEIEYFNEIVSNILQRRKWKFEEKSILKKKLSEKQDVIFMNISLNCKTLISRSFEKIKKQGK